MIVRQSDAKQFLQFRPGWDRIGTISVGNTNDLLLGAMGRWTGAQYDKFREAAGLLYCPISDSADYRRLTSLSYVWPEGDGWTMRDKVSEVLSRGLAFGRSISLIRAVPEEAGRGSYIRLQ